MANQNYFTDPLEDSFNPFEIHNDTVALKSSLDEIDNRCIRSKFKNTQDPITLAFDTIGNAPLKTLARDFVKEGFSDLISFVTSIVK